MAELMDFLERNRSDVMGISVYEFDEKQYEQDLIQMGEERGIRMGEERARAKFEYIRTEDANRIARLEAELEALKNQKTS